MIINTHYVACFLYEFRIPFSPATTLNHGDFTAFTRNKHIISTSMLIVQYYYSCWRGLTFFIYAFPSSASAFPFPKTAHPKKEADFQYGIFRLCNGFQAPMKFIAHKQAEMIMKSINLTIFRGNAMLCNAIQRKIAPGVDTRSRHLMREPLLLA